MRLIINFKKLMEIVYSKKYYLFGVLNLLKDIEQNNLILKIFQF